MPTKFCSICGGEYWARWRNTPAICESCALRAIVCPGCWKVTLLVDPAQLSLFTTPAQLAACSGADSAALWLGVRPIVALLEPRLPAQFDYELAYAALVAMQAGRHDEQQLLLAPWARPPSRADRLQHSFH
jgi:hypothetical protein